MFRASSLVAALIAAAACAPSADTTRAGATDTCGAAQYRGMIGQQVAAITVPAGVRVIMPGTVVTEDLRPERVNLIADASGKITSVECY